MKILLVGANRAGAVERSYKRAFEKLGHDVRLFDQRAKFKNSFPAGGLVRKISEKAEFVRKFATISLNNKLKQQVEKSLPDLVFVFKGTNISPKTIRYIKGNFDLKIFNFNPDNPFNDLNSSYFLLDSLGEYDCLLIWGKFLLEKLREYNGCVHYLPFGFDPDLHSLEGTLGEKDINEVAFVGSWTEDRAGWLHGLTEYDLHIWGNHWEKLPKNSELRDFWHEDPVYGEDFVEVCQGSKIMLNFIRSQNGSAHNMRTFEVPGAGGFLLTERTEEQRELFKEGEEIECFSDQSELEEKLDYYLEHRKERKRIAAAGMKKAYKNTYQERSKRILEIYKDIHG